MAGKKVVFTSMKQYIESFPPSVQKQLKQVRNAIKAGTPRAEEGISYQIPAFKLDGKYFISFAAWKNHIGVYPIPAGTPAFQKLASNYRGAKSTLNFPLDKPLPLKLIERAAKYRAAETQKAAKAKKAAGR